MKEYPYLEFYMQPVNNTLTYKEYCALYERALPSKDDYITYHEILGKTPLFTYEEMIKRERDSFESKYEKYTKITFEMLSKAIDSDEVYNDFIDECIENHYKLFDGKEYTEVDETWKK